MTRWQAIRDGVILGCVIALTLGAFRVMREASEAIGASQRPIAASAQTVTDLGVLINTSKQALEDHAKALTDIETKADTVLSNVSKASDHFEGILAAEREANTAQIKEFSKIMGEGRLLLTRTDCSLNGGPNCSVGLIPAATSTMKALDLRIADPRIDSLMYGFQVTSLHLETTTANVASMTAHGDHIIGFYDKQLTSPKGFAKTLGQGILQWIVAPGAAIATAVK